MKQFAAVAFGIGLPIGATMAEEIRWRVFRTTVVFSTPTANTFYPIMPTMQSAHSESYYTDTQYVTSCLDTRTPAPDTPKQ